MREGDDISPDDAKCMELATLEAVQAEATRALAEIVRDAVRNRPEEGGHFTVFNADLHATAVRSSSQ
jgi:hypothetical protein